MNIRRGRFRRPPPSSPATSLDIAAQDRREIRVDDRRVAAPDELDQRRDLVADRDLREAHLARERRDLPLMLGIAPGVHEDDGDRADAVRPTPSPGRGATAARSGAASTVPSARTRSRDLGDALVEHLRLDDLLGEDVRSRLVADPQRVAEASVMRRRVRSPLRSSSALVATVVPILTAAIALGRDRPSPGETHQLADAGDRGVAIGAAILGEQLARRGCAPSGSRPTMSVKVPPRSIQKSHLPPAGSCKAVIPLLRTR